MICESICRISSVKTKTTRAHWHGGVVKLEGRTYTDVVELAPATAKVVDMVADNPGTWLLHCHVADHMMAGMYATYAVLPREAVVAAHQ